MENRRVIEMHVCKAKKNGRIFRECWRISGFLLYDGVVEENRTTLIRPVRWIPRKIKLLNLLLRIIRVFNKINTSDNKEHRQGSRLKRLAAISFDFIVRSYKFCYVGAKKIDTPFGIIRWSAGRSIHCFEHSNTLTHPLLFITTNTTISIHSFKKTITIATRINTFPYIWH